MQRCDHTETSSCRPVVCIQEPSHQQESQVQIAFNYSMWLDAICDSGQIAGNGFTFGQQFAQLLFSNFPIR
jgi:hypothetical protein